MIHFFMLMIPQFSNVAFALTELLSMNTSSRKFEWNCFAIASFNDMKRVLLNCPTLSFPSPKSSEFELVTDASRFAIGSALYQILNGKHTPICFYSAKQVTELGRTYSAYDWKLLIVYRQ